ncbi:MAG: type II secretion system protein N [Halothiobacillaceae bacterium]
MSSRDKTEKRPRWWLRGIGLIVLLVISWTAAMLWLAPVQVVLDRLPAGEDVSVQSLEGNLFRGVLRLQARDVMIDRLHYRLRPASLLTGRLGLDLVAEVEGGRAQARVALSPAGAVEVRDLEGRLLADAPLAQQFAPFPLGGFFDLAIPEARLVQAGIVSLAGTLRWEDATLIAQEPVALGRVDGDVTIDAGTLVGAVRDNGTGVLAVALDLEGHQPGVLKGSLRPRQGAPDWLAATLSMVGRPNPEGAFPIRQSFQVPVVSPESAD